MARKKSGGGGGAPEWLVTFADLMSLLVCFFVLIISFSNQDEKKLQIVAGSMREAFGVQTEIRAAGMIEKDGLPANLHFRQTTQVPTPTDTDFESESDPTRPKQGPEAATHEYVTDEDRRKASFMMAAASLRQALQSMPDIAEITDNIVMRVDDEGLHVELVDQDGRAMFGSSSRQPYPVARELLSRMSPVLRTLPNRIRITGHTSAGPTSVDPNAGSWQLSADRAEVTRQILVGEGVPPDRFAAIVGKADTEPLFANDPSLAANRRISILLMDEEPPVPPDMTP